MNKGVSRDWELYIIREILNTASISLKMLLYL